MARSGMDRRKSLGSPVWWVCYFCAKIVWSHTTTVAFATLSHRRMHERRGDYTPGKNICGEDYRSLGHATRVATGIIISKAIAKDSKEES